MTTTDQQSVGAILRRCRLIAGLSRAQVARAAGLSPRQVRFAERCPGYTALSAQVAVAIGAAAVTR